MAVIAVLDNFFFQIYDKNNLKDSLSERWCKQNVLSIDFVI
jgi:hypothetical protein